MIDRYGLTLTSAPASYPVSLAEAKLHVRVDLNAEDDYITGLIAAATQTCESHIGQALVTQTWRMALDCFPGQHRQWRDRQSYGGGGGRYPQEPGAYPSAGLGYDLMAYAIEPPLAPLQSVSSIQYRAATDGTLTTLASSGYDVDTDSKPGRITPSYGNVWPVARWQPNAVLVTFVAGYGAASAVPEAIKAAIKLLVGHWYENREAVVTGTIATQLPLTVEALLMSQWHGRY